MVSNFIIFRVFQWPSLELLPQHLSLTFDSKSDAHKISPYDNPPPTLLSNHFLMNKNKGNNYQLQKLLTVNILFVLSTSYEMYWEKYSE